MNRHVEDPLKLRGCVSSGEDMEGGQRGDWNLNAYGNAVLIYEIPPKIQTLMKSMHMLLNILS